jgi:hypothetical protein
MAAINPTLLRIGDTVKVPGLAGRLTVRELLPDGRHAVCEQNGRQSWYASYILALKDLIRCEPERNA